MCNNKVGWGLFLASPFVSPTQNFSLVFAGQDPGEVLAAQGRKEQKEPQPATSVEPKKKGWCNQSNWTTMVRFCWRPPHLSFDPITQNFLAFSGPKQKTTLTKRRFSAEEAAGMLCSSPGEVEQDPEQELVDKYEELMKKGGTPSPASRRECCSTS